MDDLKGKCFRCSACGVNYDESPATGACKVCEQVRCHDCINEDGVCVPCSELKSS